MKLMKYCGLILLVVTISACIGFGDEEKIHPAVMPEDYEWGMWMSPDMPAGEQFESYAEMLNSILPALQVIAHNGILAPSVEVLHGYAQVIIHGLEGTGGPHGDLVPLEREIPDIGWEPPEGAGISDWIEHFGSQEEFDAFLENLGPSPVEELLAPLEPSLRIVYRANSTFAPWLYARRNDYIGLIHMRGGALWVIDWALPQLNTYAKEVFADDPGQQLYIEAVGNQIQALMLKAQESAIACIGEDDFDRAAAHMLDVNASLFSALGSSFASSARPVTGTGLYLLTHTLLGWTWFGFY